jgi:hypothetical protein
LKYIVVTIVFICAIFPTYYYIKLLGWKRNEREFINIKKSKLLSYMRLYIVNVVIIVLLLGTLLYLTPIGRDLRDNLAEHFIITRYQPYTWILVGHAKADLMIRNCIQFVLTLQMKRNYVYKFIVLKENYTLMKIRRRQQQWIGGLFLATG